MEIRQSFNVTAVSPASYSHFAVFSVIIPTFCPLVIMLLSCWLPVLSYTEYNAIYGAGNSVTWKVLNFAPSDYRTQPMECSCIP